MIPMMTNITPIIATEPIIESLTIPKLPNIGPDDHVLIPVVIVLYCFPIEPFNLFVFDCFFLSALLD